MINAPSSLSAEVLGQFDTNITVAEYQESPSSKPIQMGKGSKFRADHRHALHPFGVNSTAKLSSGKHLLMQPRSWITFEWIQVMKRRKRIRMLIVLLLPGMIGTFLVMLLGNIKLSYSHIKVAPTEHAELTTTIVPNANTNDVNLPTHLLPWPEFDPPAPQVYISTIIAAYPANYELDGRCALHHDTAFMHLPAENSNVEVCKPDSVDSAVIANFDALKTYPSQTVPLPDTDYQQMMLVKLLQVAHDFLKENYDSTKDYLGRLQFYKWVKQEAKSLSIPLNILKDYIQFRNLSGKAGVKPRNGGASLQLNTHQNTQIPQLLPGMTRVECSTIDPLLPERYCRTRNIAIKVDMIPLPSMSESGLDLLFKEDTLLATCSLDEEHWFEGELFGGGAAGQLFDGLNILNPQDGIECDAWVEDPLFMVSRWDTTNPFQAHQDFFNTFIVYASSKVDISKIQPVFLDSRSPDGPYVSMWSYGFSLDKSLVDIRQLPHLHRLVTPQSIPIEKKGSGKSRVLCLRDVLWGIHGGISPLSRGGKGPALCHRSQLLWSFRSFMLNQIRRAVLGPRLWYVGRDVETTAPFDTCHTAVVFERGQGDIPRTPRLHDPSPATLVADTTISEIEVIHGWEVAAGKCLLQAPLLVPPEHVVPSEAQTMNLVAKYITSASQGKTNESVWDELRDSLRKQRRRSDGSPRPFMFTITYAIRSTPSQGYPINGSLQLSPPWHPKGLFQSGLSPSNIMPSEYQKVSRLVQNEGEVIDTIRQAAKTWCIGKSFKLQHEGRKDLSGLTSLFPNPDRDHHTVTNTTAIPPDYKPIVEVRAVDFARLSFEDQVAVAQSTDFFIAPHGAVFIHLLYLRMQPVAAVLELKPPERRLGNWQFQNLAHMMRLRYAEQPIDREVYEGQLRGVELQVQLLLEDLYELRRAALFAQVSGVTWYLPKTDEPAF